MKNVNAIVYTVLGVLFIVILSTVTYAQLSGQSAPIAPRTLTILRSERLNDTTWTIETDAEAGNVTELYINGTSVTQNWAGYFGNVTGVITLDDYRNNTLYDWDLASPEGEVIAATTQYIAWEEGLFCMNQSNIYLEEGRHSILVGDMDSINATFKPFWDEQIETKWSHNHSTFYIANHTFINNSCPAANLYINDVPAPTFQEVALWHMDTDTAIWVALLVENDSIGFDGNPHDFEMLVPENGSEGNMLPTTYYFWVELE